MLDEFMTQCAVLVQWINKMKMTLTIYYWVKCKFKPFVKSLDSAVHSIYTVINIKLITYTSGVICRLDNSYR